MSENKINLRQQFIRHQVAVKAVGVMTAALLILLLGLWPLVQSAGDLIRKIDTRSKEADKLSKKVAILTQIDQQILKERTKYIKAALPETKDVVAYLSAVDGLSKELGLSFGGITVSPGEVSGQAQAQQKTGRSQATRKVASLNVLDTDIKITGNRDGIYAFLRQVEQTLPLMQVSDVVVSTIDEDTYAMTLSLGMLWSPTPSIDLAGAISLFTEKEEEYFQKLSSFRNYGSSAVQNSQNPSSRLDLFETN
jgi:Tfp pilus assembly protein PilO